MPSNLDESARSRLDDATARRLPLIALRAVMLGISLLICLGAVELLLRAAGVKPAGVINGDIALGFATPANSTETFVFPEYGGPLTMKTNNMGFHEDRDTPPVKPAGTTRIIAIGDSQTAGECANMETYPHVLETLLNANAAGRKFEVINAGVGRYSPYQYYVKTAGQLIKLKPDQLIVGLYIGNDFMDLIRRDDRPYLTRTPAGGVETHPPEFLMCADPRSKPGLLRSLRIATLTKEALGPTLVYQIRRAKMLWHDAAAEDRGITDVVRYMWEVKQFTNLSLGFMTQSLLQQVWFDRFPNTLDDALYLNRYVMERFRDVCRQNGIRLTYALVPTKLEIEPEDMTAVLRQVAARAPSYSVDRLRAFEDRLTDRALADCAELGIPAIDLRDAMRARRNGVRLYYPEEMHLNPAGNRVIGGILHDVMTGKLPASSPRRGVEYRAYAGS